MLPTPPATAIVPLSIPCITHPGAGSFFPRFFIPGAAQAQGLLQACKSRRGRLQLQPPPLPEPSPAFRGSGPRSQVLPGPAATRTLGHPPALAPPPGSASSELQPDPALTCGRAAPTPARRAESPGSRMGAGGLMDRGRRRRVAVAGAARVLAGRNGSRSTSSRSCSPPSPLFPPPPPPPPPPGSPGRMPGRGKSVLLPVSLRG